jgi:hypothetical protein
VVEGAAVEGAAFEGPVVEAPGVEGAASVAARFGGPARNLKLGRSSSDTIAS